MKRQEGTVLTKRHGLEPSEEQIEGSRGARSPEMDETEENRVPVASLSSSISSGMRRQQSEHHRFRGGTVVRRAGIDEREAKKRDAKYTRASVVMVVSFVICNTTRFVPNLMELYIPQTKFPEWAFTLISINQLLTILNSSFNFMIYLSFCGTGKKNRRQTTIYRFKTSTKVTRATDVATKATSVIVNGKDEQSCRVGSGGDSLQEVGGNCNSCGGHGCLYSPTPL